MLKGENRETGGVPKHKKDEGEEKEENKGDEVHRKREKSEI